MSLTVFGIGLLTGYGTGVGHMVAKPDHYNKICSWFENFGQKAKICGEEAAKKSFEQECKKEAEAKGVEPEQVMKEKAEAECKKDWEEKGIEWPPSIKSDEVRAWMSAEQLKPVARPESKNKACPCQAEKRYSQCHYTKDTIWFHQNPEKVKKLVAYLRERDARLEAARKAA